MKSQRFEPRRPWWGWLRPLVLVTLGLFLLEAPDIAMNIIGTGVPTGSSSAAVRFVDRVADLVVARHRAVAWTGWALVLFALGTVYRSVGTWYELWTSELVVVTWPFRHRHQLAFVTAARTVRRRPRPLPLPAFPLATGGPAELRLRTESGAFEDVSVVLKQGSVREVLLPVEESREFLRALGYRAPHVTVFT